MKTKVKKLLLRVFAVMLALYVFAGAFMILTQHKNEFDYFIDSSENMLSSLTGINNYYQSKTFKTDFLSATDMEFPIACALLDSEGNVLASSRPNVLWCRCWFTSYSISCSGRYGIPC